MNIAKNMEAVFLVAVVGFSCASAIASSKVWHAGPGRAAAVTTSIDAMNVVIVKTKRLTPAQKAALDA